MPRRKVTKDEAFGLKILELMAANGGMETQELVAATGASVDEVERIIELLRANGYLETQARARH